jgi:hypothetical protein
MHEEGSSSKSCILLGRFSQEWMARLGTDLELRFRKDPAHALRWIEDASEPAHRTWAIPLSTPDNQLDYDYAVISRIKDKTMGRWWIGVAGLTGIGTIVANRILINPQAMASIGTHFPPGWEQRNIQVLLEIKLLNGNPGDIRVVTVKSW